MSGAKPLGVGVVGLSASRGWAGRAYIAALEAVDGLELRGVAASSERTARAAAEKYGLPHAFPGVEELAASDAIDLIMIAVRVPRHRELLLAAREARKPVFCEWPLARTLDEADELVDAFSDHHTFVGLQARAAPEMRYLRDLIDQGYVGEVLSTTMLGSGIQWGPTVDSGTSYLIDRDNGATLLTIPFGHTIDAFSMVVGEFEHLAATTATRRGTVTDTDDGRQLPMTAEDQIAVHGTLHGGAVASVHYRGGESRATNFAWEINGTDGDLRISGPSGHTQSRRLTVSGARGGEGLSAMTVPERYDRFPELAGGISHALAHSLVDIIQDLADGGSRTPDFAHARERHRLLDRIQRSARTGERIDGSVAIGS